MKTASELERRNKVAQQRMENMEMVKLGTGDGDVVLESFREPLCIDTFIEKRIYLSFGGPSDGFKLTFKRYEGQIPELELASGCYFYSDWGTYEESDLRMDEAQAVFDLYMCGEASI